MTHRTMAAFCVARLTDARREAVLAQLAGLEHGDDAALRDPTVRAELEAQIELAARHGVASDEGYVELLSHRFVFGEDWLDRPAVRAVLDGRPRDEEELLASVYAALNGEDGSAAPAGDAG